MENIDLFLKRYHKHIQTNGFGVLGQEALAKSKILVVGFSDLSSPVLTYLTSMGIGTIGIVGSEKILLEDLPSQPLYFNNQEGKLKGQSAAVQLREINPQVKVILHEQPLTNKNILSVFSDYDIVVDTGNDRLHSLLINDGCVITGKPMIYGALLPPSGHYSVFNYKRGPTFRCMLSHPEINNLFLQQKYGFASLAGIIGSFLVNEVVKIIGEIGEVATEKLYVLNSFTNKLASIKIDLIPEHRTISSLQEDYSKDINISSDPSPIRSISTKLLALKMKYKESLQLIDIRENQNGGEDIWNFLHLPESEILNRIEQIHQDIMVILISANGESARSISVRLNKKHGFDNIYYLQGGFDEWKKETDKQDLTYESF